MNASPRPRRWSARNVTAVLGPTNTGKTHLAIERMLGHESGIIGLPLRLLAPAYAASMSMGKVSRWNFGASGQPFRHS